MYILALLMGLANSELHCSVPGWPLPTTKNHSSCFRPFERSRLTRLKLALAIMVAAALLTITLAPLALAAPGNATIVPLERI
jgi:hypothetical protein